MVTAYEKTIKRTTVIRDDEGGSITIKHYHDNDGVMISQDGRDHIWVASGQYAEFMKAMERPT